MKQRKVLLVIGSGFVLALGGAAILKLTQGHPRGIAVARIVNSDGDRLASVFQGSKPDPANRPTRMHPKSRQCQSAPGRMTFMERFKSHFLPTVQAQGCASNDPCGGAGWLDGPLLPCGGTGCGTYKYPTGGGRQTRVSITKAPQAATLARTAAPIAT